MFFPDQQKEKKRQLINSSFKTTRKKGIQRLNPLAPACTKSHPPQLQKHRVPLLAAFWKQNERHSAIIIPPGIWTKQKKKIFPLSRSQEILLFRTRIYLWYPDTRAREFQMKRWCFPVGATDRMQAFGKHALQHFRRHSACFVPASPALIRLLFFLFYQRTHAVRIKFVSQLSSAETLFFDNFLQNYFHDVSNFILFENLRCRNCRRLEPVAKENIKTRACGCSWRAEPYSCIIYYSRKFALKYRLCVIINSNDNFTYNLLLNGWKWSFHNQVDWQKIM